MGSMKVILPQSFGELMSTVAIFNVVLVLCPYNLGLLWIAPWPCAGSAWQETVLDKITKVPSTIADTLPLSIYDEHGQF